MCADGHGAGDALVDIDSKTDAEFFSNALRLDHHSADEGACVRVVSNVFQGGVRERADGVERQIAPQFDPKFIANARSNGGLKTSSDERFGERRHAVGLFAGWFAKGESIAFDMGDDPWRGDFSRGVDHAADHALRTERLPLRVVGVEAADARIAPRSV